MTVEKEKEDFLKKLFEKEYPIQMAHTALKKHLETKIPARNNEERLNKIICQSSRKRPHEIDFETNEKYDKPVQFEKEVQSVRTDPPGENRIEIRCVQEYFNKFVAEAIQNIISIDNNIIIRKEDILKLLYYKDVYSGHENLFTQFSLAIAEIEINWKEPIRINLETTSNEDISLIYGKSDQSEVYTSNRIRWSEDLTKLALSDILYILSSHALNVYDFQIQIENTQSSPHQGYKDKLLETIEQFEKISEGKIGTIRIQIERSVVFQNFLRHSFVPKGKMLNLLITELIINDSCLKFSTLEAALRYMKIKNLNLTTEKMDEDDVNCIKWILQHGMSIKTICININQKLRKDVRKYLKRYAPKMVDLEVTRNSIRLAVKELCDRSGFFQMVLRKLSCQSEIQIIDIEVKDEILALSIETPEWKEQLIYSNLKKDTSIKFGLYTKFVPNKKYLELGQVEIVNFLQECFNTKSTIKLMKIRKDNKLEQLSFLEHLVVDMIGYNGSVQSLFIQNNKWTVEECLAVTECIGCHEMKIVRNFIDLKCVLEAIEKFPKNLHSCALVSEEALTEDVKKNALKQHAGHETKIINNIIEITKRQEN